MAQPVWITPAGSLGTIPEGVFYEVPLEAYDPDGGTVFYELVAGQLPAGIQVANATGVMVGVPQAIALIEGVPTPVTVDVTSKFAIRAYTKNNLGKISRLSDRTFTLTVTAQNRPEFVTPPGQIAEYFDGSQVFDLQIEYTNVDPASITTIRLAGGQLPPGLNITSTGLISGFIEPNTSVGEAPGFSRDGIGYDSLPFDYDTHSSNTNYAFVLELADGATTNLRAFTILVLSRDACTADDTQITADSTFVTADCTPTRTPILLTPQGSIGTVRNDNFYAFKFDGIDLDGDAFEYDISIGNGIGFDAADVSFTSGSYDFPGEGFDRGGLTLPPGLSLDPATGWLYGFIPDLGVTELTYTFAVRVRKVLNPDVVSNFYFYSINIIGNLSTEVTWLTPTDPVQRALVPSYLGAIDNGMISTFYVAAVNRNGIPLQYRLESGSDSNLPQGLQLLPDGEIAGRVSFDTFALDGGTTTFDVKSSPFYNPNSNPTTGVGTETTFDMLHTFTVNAYSNNGVVSVYKQFSIRVVRRYNEPFDNLYIQAMPPENDRALLNSLLQSNDIFPQDLLYRPQDPNFGLATKVIYQHAYGLSPATLDDYVASLNLNHYYKSLVLGQVKTAQAVDDNGNVLYEVVYSAIIDNLVNNQGDSVGKEVVLPYPITVNNSQINTVYPNSLQNMRTQVIDTVGQISNVLPRWMLSKQANGSVLGFIPAWVICYTKPGRSGQIAYNIRTIFGEKLNLVDFDVDRYELDNLLTKNWNRSNQQWNPTPPSLTTFDVYARPSELVSLGNVDYATDLAFIDINDQPLSYINSLDGFDGPITSKVNGKTIIFVQQEGYYNLNPAYPPGPITNDQAWTNYLQTYDTVGYSADTTTFDESIVIPGQQAAQMDPVLTNQRMGIWLITVDDKNIVHLTLLQNTTSYDFVKVLNGTRYGGARLYVPQIPGPGLLLINWQYIPISTQGPTVFDGNSLQFIAPVDMYTNTQIYDKYLVFPKRNILE